MSFIHYILIENVSAALLVINRALLGGGLPFINSGYVMLVTWILLKIQGC
jgi:hypothetical protein